MKAIDGRNNVKVYNLSAGKTLPDWLSEKKRRKLIKKDVDVRRRIELIQDFDMPDISNCVKSSPDGQYILASGTYKPRLKCYEVSALSLKFERCFDAEIIEFEVLSEDYSKIVFLEEERYVEFHNQGGRWFRTRIPKFGRDIAYHYPSCDLYIGASGSEIYRLNLNQGQFLNSIQTDSPSINKCVFNPVHYLLSCGTEDGKIEAWDPRSRHRVGILDCAIHMFNENVQLPMYKSSKELGVTALAYYDALTLGVGTQTGKILLYDIRMNKPLLVKDHMDGLPIKDLEFHSSGMAISMSQNAVKIWEKDTGKPHTSMESDVKFNDLCTIPGSGMIFLATEHPKMQIYFLPSLGPAPKWCSHLDSLIEELEEDEISPAYDDYKFVTEAELLQLGLQDLIGSNILQAVMHGYYMDVRLYNNAKLRANPFDYEKAIKRKVKEKVSESNEKKMFDSKKLSQKLPEVNKESFTKLNEEKHTGKRESVTIAKAILEDDRFGSLFSNRDFSVDKESEMFGVTKPFMKNKKNSKEGGDSSDEECEESDLKDIQEPGVTAEESSSDSDSIISDYNEKNSEIEEEQEDERHTSVKKSKKSKFNKLGETKEVETSQTGEFRSADTLAELREDWKKLSRMPLGKRLTKEDVSEPGIPFGSRVMEFPLKKSGKFERLRKEQQQHHKERKSVVRSAAQLKGKIRMNKPDI